MKYFKITITEGDSLKNAAASAEKIEEVEEICKKNKLENYKVSEISLDEFKKMKGKTPETKAEISKKFEASHKETAAIDIAKFKGKKIIPFKDCPYRIEEKYQSATKENILLVAGSLNPFGFKDAKSAARYLLSIGFEIK